MRMLLGVLLAVAFGGAASDCPMDKEIAEGMYWIYEAELIAYSSPGLVFSYEFTLTIQTEQRLESPPPAGFEGLSPLQGWSLRVTLDKPWERRAETVAIWQASEGSIIRWPIPVLFVADQDFLYPFLFAAATVGIARRPDGSAVLVRDIQGPGGEIIPVRVELNVGQGDGVPARVAEFGEACRVDYKAEAWGREHQGSAWWSDKVQGWVYAEGEVTELRSLVLRYRIELKDWWGHWAPHARPRTPCLRTLCFLYLAWRENCSRTTISERARRSPVPGS